MSKIYVKIYTDENDTVLVIKGRNCEDVETDEIQYYHVTNPDKMRLGTVVTGKNAIEITPKAKELLRKLYHDCSHTGDDISSFNIYKLDNGNICVSYMGPLWVGYNVEESIANSDCFWWGEGEGKINLDLLDDLICVEEINEDFD